MNGITISPFGSTSQFDNYNTDAELTEFEMEAISYIKQTFLDNGEAFDVLRFCRRSQDYLTILSPNDIDFCRIKVTSRSIWFSVNGLRLSEALKNDIRFEGVKKTSVHWKVKLNCIEDFKDNSDLILESYVSIK